jgi:ornithine carbamoyltransferase
MSQLTGRDLLTLGDWTSSDVQLVLSRAGAMKRNWKLPAGMKPRPLANKSAALIFLKPSMRTRVSFELAVAQLGGIPIVLGSEDAFSRNETVHDTVKALERYVDAIVLRTFAQSHVEEVAQVASVPVINALTDDYHPCQVLADLLTIQEHKGELAGLTLAWVGDGNNMLNTLLIGCAHVGMNLRAAVPEGFEPLAEAEARAAEIAETSGSRLQRTTDPAWAVEGADIVITDTWTSMGQEAEHDARARALAVCRVTPELMGQASDGAIFMHCLPAHRGQEVVDEVIDAGYSVVFDEAENRLHVQKAILSLVAGAAS